MSVIAFGFVAAFAVASSAYAADWGTVATISSTMGANGNRLCMGEGTRATDIGCPNYAPSVTTAGDVSVSGNLSANKFIGDGSGLTGVTASSGDRITSGTTLMVVVSNTGFISLTQAGTNTGWFDPTRGLVTIGVSSTGPISGTSGFFTGNLTTNSSLTMSLGTYQLQMYIDHVAPGFPARITNNGSGPNSLNIDLNTIISGTFAINSGATTGLLTALPLNNGGSTNNATAIGISFNTASGSPPAQPAKTLIAGVNRSIWGINDIVFALNNVSDHSAVALSDEKMRITSAGNVGIGTISPNAKLEVSGTISSTLGYFTQGIAVGKISGGSNIQFSNLSGAAKWEFYIPQSNNNDLRIWDSVSATDRVSFQAGTGNVGIGTTAPSSTLHIYGGSDSSTIILGRAGQPSRWGLLDYSGSYMSIGTTGSDGLVLQTSNTERLRVNSLGNVGISTSNPNAKLDVYGTISATNFVGDGSGLTGLSASGERITSGTTSMVANSNTNIISITTAGVTTGYFDSAGRLVAPGISVTQNYGVSSTTGYFSGNVGIGTAPSGTKLMVSMNTALLPAPPYGTIAHFGTADGDGNRMLLDVFANSGNYSVRRANGTAAAPSALLAGDPIGTFAAFGYGSTGYSAFGAARINLTAAENWTDTAQGTYINFVTTGLGTTSAAERMRIDGSGNVGIGTGVPAASLTVVGEVQVSNSGVACSGTTKGALRYNNPSNTMEYCNSTAWTSLGPSSSVPAFSVNKGGTNQTVTSGSWTKLTWSTENFDTNNNFAGDKFTPTVAGKYIVTLTVRCQDSTSYCTPAIFKNGLEILEGNYIVANSIQTQNITGVVDMNGSTDYLEAYIANGGGTTVGGQAVLTYFTGALLGSGGGSGGGATNPGGNTTNVQYNNGGAFSGSDNFAWVNGSNTVSVTGTVSATYGYFTYISATNGLGTASGDRITSGTLVAVANSATGYISLTTNGTTWGYLSSGANYLPYVSATSSQVSNVLAFNGQNVTAVAGSGGNYIVSGTSSVSVTSAGTIKFQTGGSQRMQIDSSGNLSIGTTNTSGVMTLAGAPSTATFYMSGGRMQLYPSSSGGDQGLQIDSTNLASGSNMIFLNAPGAWTGNFISANLGGVQKFHIDQTGAYSASSDARLKTDIKTIPHALEKIALLRGVTFHWKDPATNRPEQVGVIAQEVQKAFPQLVSADPSGTLSVNYQGLVAPLIEAVKELKAANDNLRGQVGALKADNDNLRRSVERQGRDIERLMQTTKREPRM